MRVYELAKKLDLSSKELIELLAAYGHQVKSHMAVVSDEMERDLLASKKIKAPEGDAKPSTGKTAPEVKQKTPVPTDAPDAKKSVPEVQIEREAVERTDVASVAMEVPPAKVDEKKPIQIEMPITVGALADKLKIRVSDLIKTLIGLGIFANINQLLNEELVWKAAKALGIEIEKLEDEDAKKVFELVQDDTALLKPRLPIVTLMGHVDHGKTSLLDAIRKSNLAEREVGRITQHIGAYCVDIQGKGTVTFLDTPGHEAFTAMRARGANVTDVVVLVVAADDGIMPQTVEAIDHARAANCPIVVAINKIDLPTSNPQRVMADLQKHDLTPEEWGGKTICVKVSAKTGTGIEELLELLCLEAEILELKANPDRPAQGIVLEAKLTKGRGAVSTVIVQNGTLKPGDLVVAGPFYGRARALLNDRGKPVNEAGPSYAVEVLGLSGTPEAGEPFAVVEDEKVGRKIAEKRALELRERAMKGLHPKHLSLEELYGQVKEGKIKELKLIIKADVQGSIEALQRTLEQHVSDKISVRVLHGGVGAINESDIMLAAASDAIVIGFHVRPDDRAQVLSESEGVEVRLYNIIYEALEDIRKAMEGLLEPTLKEVVEGKVQIRQVFSSSKIGTIGGAYVLKGRVARNHKVRVIRDNIVIHDGRLASLKRFKDDVREVQEGYDCGVVLEGFKNLQEGDLIESYRVEKIASKLS